MVEPNQINYESLKELAKNEKETWSNTYDYYTPKRQWGAKYGYQLKPAYTKNEIDDCLLQKGITLPISLYRYLTEVSREIVFGSYPTEINIHHLPSFSQCQSVILNNIKCINDKNLYYSDSEDEDDNNNDNLIVYSNFSFTTVTICDNGCSFSEIIYLGSGNEYGSIWYSDGDYINKK